MAVIETKYSIGDVVFHAGTATTRKQHPCPDCKGERKWQVKSPAGGEYTISCPRCTSSFMSDRDLSLDYTAHVPSVSRLTIGSVQFNSAPRSYDSGARYMCCETGVGSGSVYNEERLFATEDEALAASQAMADSANAETGWITKLYNKSLEISDYKIENAAMKLAKDYKSKISSLFWNISDLFEQIENADDKDAILEVINDYKKYTWERDKASFRAQGIEAGTDETPQAVQPEGQEPGPKDAP